MSSFHKIKAPAVALMLGILLATAFAASARAGGALHEGLTAPQWKAVRARAEAMDRYYHLGPYSQVALAEKKRANATDRFYHLGRYGVLDASSPFQWSDAGIGAGAMLGALLVGGGLVVALRRHGKPSVPRTI